MTRRHHYLPALLAAGAVAVPLVFLPTTEETFAVPKLFALGVVVALGGVVALATRTRIRWRIGDALAALLFVLIGVSFLTSIDRHQSLWGEPLQRQGLVAAALYIATYFLARAAMNRRPHRRMLIWGISLGATLVAAYAVVQGLELDPLWEPHPRGRVFSTIGQPNALGAYLAMAVPLTLVAAARRHPLNWVIFGAAAVLQMVAMVMTASRGAALGLAAGLLVAFLVLVGTSVASGGRFLVMILLTVGGLAAAVVWVPPAADAAQRLVDRIVSNDLDLVSQSEAHVELWEVARHITLDHAVVGTGPDTFPLVFPAYSDAVLEPERAERFARHRVESPHNIYLALSTGSGVLALTVFLLLVLAALVGCFRRARHRFSLRSAGIAAALAAYLTTHFFITAELAATWIFWLLVGTAVGMNPTSPAGETAEAGKAQPVTG